MEKSLRSLDFSSELGELEAEWSRCNGGSGDSSGGDGGLNIAAVLHGSATAGAGIGQLAHSLRRIVSSVNKPPPPP